MLFQNVRDCNRLPKSYLSDLEFEFSSRAGGAQELARLFYAVDFEGEQSSACISFLTVSPNRFSVVYWKYCVCEVCSPLSGVSALQRFPQARSQ